MYHSSSIASYLSESNFVLLALSVSLNKVKWGAWDIMLIMQCLRYTLFVKLPFHELATFLFFCPVHELGNLYTANFWAQFLPSSRNAQF
jgi:hypothetical protein